MVTKISGHICQGHIDTVGEVLSVKMVDRSYIFDLKILTKHKIELISSGGIMEFL